MGRLEIGGRALSTRFAIPGGAPRDVLRQLDETALGLHRARIAARLGNPDPFHVRVALVEAISAGPPSREIAPVPGEPLDAPAADASLVRAAVASAEPPELVAGLFAWEPPAAPVRAVPIDDARFRSLRFRDPDPGDAPAGPVRRWTTEEIGLPGGAVVRCVAGIPGGVALGSDAGLVVARGERFEPMPWPEGARAAARGVAALAWHGGALHAAATRATYRWDLRGRVEVDAHPGDDEGGWDEVAAMLAAETGLLAAWRTRMAGGEGPADALSLAEVPGGVVFAGTRAGGVHVVGGRSGEAVRDLAAAGAKPARHLAYGAGRLWVAAGGKLHAFDGASWSATAGEATALASDAAGRPWMVRGGVVHRWGGGGFVPLAESFERPWSIGAGGGATWIGGVGWVARVGVGRG